MDREQDAHLELEEGSWCSNRRRGGEQDEEMGERIRILKERSQHSRRRRGEVSTKTQSCVNRQASCLSSKRHSARPNHNSRARVTFQNSTVQQTDESEAAQI
mgnify:CR=1 FL=1